MQLATLEIDCKLIIWVSFRFKDLSISNFFKLIMHIILRPWLN